MRKDIVAHTAEPAHGPNGSWMDLEFTARVQLTSEDPAYPIESALQDPPGKGWRAAQSGPQTIWINFDAPQALHEISLRFQAAERRTQEFVLLSSNDDGRSYREIVRQQFNFSPDSTPAEEETYFLHLIGVTDLKLTIIPDISGGDARTTLHGFRLR